MLSKIYRFHSRGGVNYVHQHGKTVRSSVVTLTFMPNSRGFRRFAVVISKKVVKSAVGRNRIRRRVFEAIRSLDPASLPPIDCIFSLYSPNLATMPFPDLTRLIANLLDQALANLDEPNHSS